MGTIIELLDVAILFGADIAVVRNIAEESVYAIFTPTCGNMEMVVYMEEPFDDCSLNYVSHLHQVAHNPRHSTAELKKPSAIFCRRGTHFGTNRALAVGSWRHFHQQS